MHIAIIGATGNAGSRILAEALQRGHQVHALVRPGSSLTPAATLTVGNIDLAQIDSIAASIAGSDAVISAYGPPPGDASQLVATTQKIVAAVAKNHGPRLLVVGGAGSLFVSPGVTLIESGYLPPEWMTLAKAHEQVLRDLQASEIDWTSFSPAAYFEPGTRTGTFRLGGDDLIADSEGNSRISMEDYAIAAIDEIEQPRYRKARFTIGYAPA